jgi:rare lipoprotein A
MHNIVRNIMRINRSRILFCFAALAMLALAGCGTAPTVNEPVSKTPRTGGPVIKSPSTTKPSSGLPELPPANSGRGGYYQDDGPGDAPPPNLADVPDADVRNDPLLPRSNRPYVVFGKTYTPITDNQPFTQIGVGSWYGKKFHGQRTSSGEIYDMYKMTAAHPTLPIPSYARLTNLVSGAVVVVRINDRGPFHDNRLIDLSYAAAVRIGVWPKGTGLVEVRAIDPAHPDAAPPPSPRVITADAASARIYLQLGAFGDLANAERVAGAARRDGIDHVDIQSAGVNGHTVHRVRVGPLADVAAADALTPRIERLGFGAPRVAIER